MPWSILSEGGVPDEYPEHMKERFIGLLTPENNLTEPYSAFAGNIAIDSIGRDLLHMLEMINDNKKIPYKRTKRTKFSETLERYDYKARICSHE